MRRPAALRRTDSQPLLRAIARELARFGGGSVNDYLQMARALLRDAVETATEAPHPRRPQLGSA